MSIPEAQLETWSHQGSIVQSAATYRSIRNNLERADAPYISREYSIFLQGSYGNDTNIYADSDVDIVINLGSIYYADKSSLSPVERAAYEADTSVSQYTWSQFRGEVIQHLTSIYGADVRPGSKAIAVLGNGTRRDADVLPAANYRLYTRYAARNDYNYIEGICFWLPDGSWIVNFPKQHSENCTAKHQGTASWYKPTVRIIKNMRNTLVARGHLESGLAPSYFIEGMIYNVPDHKFGTSYSSTFTDVLNWLLSCNPETLKCANGYHQLLHPASPVAWRRENFDQFLRSLVGLWNGGG